MLAIQYTCNAQRVNIPWDAVGATMGDGISGGAVVQHLAKLRQRMVNAEESVPPPLRRGGHLPGSPSTRTSKATPTKRTTARNATAKAGKPNATKRKFKSMSDTSDEGEEGYEIESEAEYGTSSSKRSSNNKGGARKIKKDASGDDAATTSRRGKYQRSATPATPTQKGKPMGINLESDGDIESDEDMETASDGNGGPYIAAGAPFLALEDDAPSKGTVGRKTVAKQSLVVKLPMHCEAAMSRLKKCAEEKEGQENSEDGDSENEDDSDTNAEDGDIGEESLDLVSAIVVPAQQHQFVSGFNTPSHVAAQAQSNARNRFVSNNVGTDFFNAEHGLQAAALGTDGLGRYSNMLQDQGMAFDDGHFADATWNDENFVASPEWAPTTFSFDNSNNTSSFNNSQNAFNSNKLQIQTNFGPQAALPDKSNGYYSTDPSIVNQTPSSGSIDRNAYSWPGFNPSADNVTDFDVDNWVHGGTEQPKIDLKPAENDDFTYNA